MNSKDLNILDSILQEISVLSKNIRYYNDAIEQEIDPEAIAKYENIVRVYSDDLLLAIENLMFNL